MYGLLLEYFISFHFNLTTTDTISRSADSDKWDAGRELKGKHHLLVVMPENEINNTKIIKSMSLLCVWDLRTKGTGTYIVKSTGIVWIKASQEMAWNDFHNVTLMLGTESVRSVSDDKEFHRGTS